MRVFISVSLPESLRAEIFHEINKLEEAGHISGIFVEKDNLHITLAFLGELDEKKIVLVKEKLKGVKFPKFNVLTGKFGFFPNEDHIKVIWLEMISPELAKFQKEIDKVLSPLQFKIDTKEFIPHLTFARVKEVHDKQKLLEKMSKLKVIKGKFEVSKFELMKSELKRDGPSYKSLEEFKL